jgi:hypothetical protein
MLDPTAQVLAGVGRKDVDSLAHCFKQALRLKLGIGQQLEFTIRWHSTE